MSVGLRRNETKDLRTKQNCCAVTAVDGPKRRLAKAEDRRHDQSTVIFEKIVFSRRLRSTVKENSVSRAKNN